MSMISVKGLRKTFGKNEVLKGVDIEIRSRQDLCAKLFAGFG